MRGLYGTTDFYLVCAVMASKIKLVKVEAEPEKPHIKKFFFENTEELQKVVLSHYNGTLQLSSLDYSNTQEQVKRIIRN